MAVRIEIGIDANDLTGLADFWAQALRYLTGDVDGAGTYLDLVPPSTALPIVYLQRVSEEKTAKNRLHLDLFADDAVHEVERLVDLGASRIGPPRTGSEGGWWQVMADPEGNEFCVCSAEAEPAP